MINSITIHLPDDLKRKAQEEADRRGIGFEELVAVVLRDAVASGHTGDRMLDDHEVYYGPAPSDLSENLDDYLYGKIDP